MLFDKVRISPLGDFTPPSSRCERNLDLVCLSLQFDPEGFGEIPLEDFVAALRSPEWRAEIPTNKRDILLSRAKESRVQAVTFQDFVNVVSPDALHAFPLLLLCDIEGRLICALMASSPSMSKRAPVRADGSAACCLLDGKTLAR